MAVHPPAPIIHLLRPRHRLRGLFAVFARTARSRNLIRTPAPCTAQHPQWLPTLPPIHSLLAGHLHCGIRSPFPVPRQLRFATAQCPLHMVHALLPLYIALSGYHWSSRDLVIPSAHSTDVPNEASARIPVHAELARPRSPSGHDTGPHDHGPVSPTHRAVLSAPDSSFSSMAAPTCSGTLRRLRSSSSLSSDATSHAPNLSEDLGGMTLTTTLRHPRSTTLSWNCLQTTRRSLGSGLDNPGRGAGHHSRSRDRSASCARIQQEPTWAERVGPKRESRTIVQRQLPEQATARIQQLERENATLRSELQEIKALVEELRQRERTPERAVKVQQAEAQPRGGKRKAADPPVDIEKEFSHLKQEIMGGGP
ncbi:hypothetical protein MRX96_042240 [Rhipicephalus microplus]